MRHALLVSSPVAGPVTLARELGQSWAGRVAPQHAAILRHDEDGGLDVVVACDGVLGRIVGRRTSAALLVGPVSLIALALSDLAELRAGLGPFRHSIRPSIQTLASALPTATSALML